LKPYTPLSNVRFKRSLPNTTRRSLRIKILIKIKPLLTTDLSLYYLQTFARTQYITPRYIYFNGVALEVIVYARLQGLKLTRIVHYIDSVFNAIRRG
jgi:hypothetical protein